MTLKEILLSGVALDDLVGGSVATVFQEIVSQLAAKDVIAATAEDEIRDAFIAREAEGSTAFGAGFAMPHIFHEGSDRVIVAVARHPEGVDMQALDGQNSHVFIILIGPESARETYMQVLSHIASVAQDRSWRKAIEQSLRSEDILELLAEAVTA